MGGEESEKIIRVSGDNLLIQDSPDEEKYRSKYLPDPTKLTDEKLVCTVCSAALAQDIHKGRTIYVHRLLHVLVCEGCFNFYGDGCFSTDEDGDDKYCRWCGQGGTLYLCSACNCAFCQKCVKQNLKASVVAELEKDDWKCYFCNPRPLFGCRTICWGAGELNKIGKEKEKERLRKQKERLEKVGGKKKEENGRSRKVSSSSDDEVLSKKRKTRHSSDSSSPEVMPKKVKRSSRSLNGSISRGRKKRNDSESDDSEDNKVVRQSRSRNNRKPKKESDSSSSEDSDTKSKRKKSKIKRKKAKGSSDEASEEDKKKSKAKNRSKKKVESFDDSSDEKSTNKKKKSKKKKNDSTSEESEDNKRTNKSKQKKKKEASSDEDSDDDKKSTKKAKDEKYIKKKYDDKVEENKSKPDSKENKTSSHEDALVKKRIKLAIMWLGTALKDISELGNLIAIRAAKFSKKKINADNLKTYDDVLTTVAKLRQLINGVHSNYSHIEKTLDSQLKPWKILTGLEEPDNEKPVEEVKAPEDSVAESHESEVIDEPNSSVIAEQKPAEEKKENSDNSEMQLRLSDEMLSPDDDSENDQSTRDAVAKASEVLEKDQESENNQVNKGTDETALNNSISNAVCNDSLQQDNSKSEPDDVRSDESDADAKNKTPKKSGYKSLLGSNKIKDQDEEKTSLKDSNKSVVEDSDSEGVIGKDSNKSVVNNSDSEGVTGQNSNKSAVEDLDSDGGEEVSKKLPTPNKSVREDSSSESEKETKKEKPKPLSKKGKLRKASKGMRDSKGQ